MIHRNKLQIGLITGKVLIAIILVIVLVVAGSAALYRYTNILGNNSHSSDERDAKTTSSAPTAQDNFNEGDQEKSPGNTVQENEGNAIINDNQGDIDDEVDTSNPTSSSTGEIAVYEPKNNQLISSDFTIAGTSKLKTVSYRLVDNVSGVIASGRLNVVSGKFSGDINFNTTASEGRIDIYGTRDDGTEFSNIQIPIRFK